MLTFALKKKRTPSIAPKRPAPTTSTMTHSMHVQRAKVRHILHGPTLQPKLTIGAPNDKYEKEADRVADEVMRMPEPRLQCQVEPEEEEETLQAKTLAGQITPLVQRQVEPEEEEEAIQAKLADGMQVQRQVEEPEEEEEPIQTKRVGRTHQISSSLVANIRSTRGRGQSLPWSVRNFFEPRFGCDFSEVRIHSDSKAERLSRALNARAFTTGQDIFFCQGVYEPGNSGGQELLAHELTHVVQQGNAQVRPKLGIRKPNNMFVCGANGVKQQITSGVLRIQRQAGSPPPQCARAAGRVIFILYASGINTGATYLRPGTRVDFSNADNTPHRIRISPSGLFTHHSFTINPGGRVIVWVSGVSRLTGGSIIDRPGRGQTVHDVVVCP